VSSDRGLLSDIVKRGSRRSCGHEQSCARVHVFAALASRDPTSCFRKDSKPKDLKSRRGAPCETFVSRVEAFGFQSPLSVRSREVKLVFLSCLFMQVSGRDE
jgi:hypothetical protein